MVAFYPAYHRHTSNGHYILGAAEVLLEVALPLSCRTVAMAIAVFVISKHGITYLSFSFRSNYTLYCIGFVCNQAFYHPGYWCKGSPYWHRDLNCCLPGIIP